MHILSPETYNYPSGISGRERMTVEIFRDQSSRKDTADLAGIQLATSLISSQMCIQLSHLGQHISDTFANIMQFSIKVCTVNPLYNDTRYSEKICYTDNLNVTTPSLRR